MALTATQQALLLFKKLMGKGSTNLTFDFFNEPKNGRPAVYKDQFWSQSDLIPTTAPGATAGVVQKFTDQALTAVAGTTNAFSHANLIDAIPFNFGDGTSYNYTVKDSLGNPIAFGVGDWIVDPDTGTLTFYGSVPSNMPPTISFYKYVGTKGASNGGGGAGSLRWEEDSQSPVSEIYSAGTGIRVYSFELGAFHRLWAMIAVPSSYVAGTQITMKVQFVSADSSGTALFGATSYLIRPGTDLLVTTSNSYASTNAAVTLSGATVGIPQTVTLDLTNSSGQINGVAVQPGQLIRVRLMRSGDTATSELKLLPYATEVKTS
jgi:hypothetical protein